MCPAKYRQDSSHYLSEVYNPNFNTRLCAIVAMRKSFYKHAIVHTIKEDVKITNVRTGEIEEAVSQQHTKFFTFKCFYPVRYCIDKPIMRPSGI